VNGLGTPKQGNRREQDLSDRARNLARNLADTLDRALVSEGAVEGQRRTGRVAPLAGRAVEQYGADHLAADCERNAGQGAHRARVKASPSSRCVRPERTARHERGCAALAAAQLRGADADHRAGTAGRWRCWSLVGSGVRGIAVVVWLWGHHQISSCRALADDSFLHPGSTVPDSPRASGADRSPDLTDRAAGAFSMCTGSNIGDAVRHAMTLAPPACGTNAGTCRCTTSFAAGRGRGSDYQIKWPS